MTGIEFLRARQALGLTQRQMAERLMMGAHGWQSISKWETGKTPVPGPVEVAIGYIMRDAGL